MEGDKLRCQLEFRELRSRNVQSIVDCKDCQDTPFSPCDTSCSVKYKPILQKVSTAKIVCTDHDLSRLNGEWILKASLKDTDRHTNIDLMYMMMNPSMQITHTIPDLYFGVMSNCEHIVKKLVDAGNDVNQSIGFSRYDVWKPLLHLAVINQQPKVLQTLLHCGADPSIPDGKGFLAIHKAARLGNVDLVSLLLAHGAKVDQASATGYTALQFAVYHKRRDVVRLLLEKGADPYYKSPEGLGILHLAMDRYDEEIANEVFRYKLSPDDKLTTNGDTILLFIMNSNRSYQTNGSCCGCPFSSCTETDQMKCKIMEKYAGVIKLLEHGANPNTCNNEGGRPIHYAVHNGCPHLVRKLLEHGAEANPNSLEDLRSPLEVAVMKKCVATIKQLLTYGADPSVLLVSELRLDPLIKKTIDQHLIATQALGLKVNEVMMSMVEKNDEITTFKIECHKQIKELKKTVLNTNNFTAYDLLRVNRRGLAAAASGHYSRSMYDMIPVAMGSAPIYKNMIEIKFRTAQKYAPILKKATMSLDALCNYQLNTIPLEKIVSFLNFDEMKNVIITVQKTTVKKGQ